MSSNLIHNVGKWIEIADIPVGSSYDPYSSVLSKSRSMIVWNDGRTIGIRHPGGLCSSVQLEKLHKGRFKIVADPVLEIGDEFQCLFDREACAIEGKRDSCLGKSFVAQRFNKVTEEAALFGWRKSVFIDSGIGTLIWPVDACRIIRKAAV